MPEAEVANSKFSLYIVRCVDGTLYTGIATDVSKRLAEHQTSPRGAKYLRGKGPLQVVFSEVVGDRASALIEGRSALSELASVQVRGEGGA